MKTAKGFTLIELLVVISIISLLASVVLASLNTARDKGRLAAGKEFAATVDHVAGDYAVGLWDFSECSGAFVGDRSSLGNNGTFTNPSWSTNTPAGSGCSASFDGSTNFITVPNSSSLQPLSGDFSVSFWIYRLGTGTSDYPQIIGSRPWSTGVDKGWAVSYSTITSKLATHFADGTTGWDVTAGVQSASLVALNSWQQWTVVFDRANGKLTFYLDGKLDAQYTPGFPSGSINQTDAILMGFDQVSSRKLNAILDNVHVFTKTLTAAEAGRLYAEESAIRRFSFNSCLFSTPGI